MYWLRVNLSGVVFFPRYNTGDPLISREVIVLISVIARIMFGGLNPMEPLRPKTKIHVSKCLESRPLDGL